MLRLMNYGNILNESDKSSEVTLAVQQLLSDNQINLQKESIQMSNDIALTVVGNLVADPELRYTQGGEAVANFTVATTPRRYSTESQEWEDGETIFTRCTLWREAAENLASSLEKGMRVIVTGNMEAKPWEDKEGNRRVNHEVNVQDIGPSLRFAIAKVNKVEPPKKEAAKKPVARAKATSRR